MENERWKVHICLISIVLAAIVIGVCYYYASSEKQMEDVGGVLVKIGQEIEHGC